MADHPVLAIDYGDARIGVAATDEFAIAAHAVETVKNDEAAVARLVELIKGRRVQTVVMGLPLRMDRSEGTSAEKVRAFAARLQQEIPELPLQFHDESFTTQTAAEKLRQGGKNAKQQKAIIDQAAALEILNDYLGW